MPIFSPTGPASSFMSLYIYKYLPHTQAVAGNPGLQKHAGHALRDGRVPGVGARHRPLGERDRRARNAGLCVASDGLKCGPRAVGSAIGRRRAVACACLIKRAAAARSGAGRGIGPGTPATVDCGKTRCFH
jgi:hypothetical protein